ncbi:MAG: hypothetical protein AAGA90_07850 [Actinomycetota bacterium]
MTRHSVATAQSLADQVAGTAKSIRVWPTAVDGAAEMLAGSYPSNTLGGGGSAKGTPSTPTEHAALSAELDDASRIHAELLAADHALRDALTRYDRAIEASVDAGYTTAPGVRCAKCGRIPTRVVEGKEPLVNGVCLHCRCVVCDAIPSNEGMDRLVEGVCIAHRCSDCGAHPSGEGNDRLRGGRCPKCYWRNRRRQEAALAEEQT